MSDVSAGGFDNLSNLGGDLKRIEGIYISSTSVELAHARNSLVGALPGFRMNRMSFGRVLRAYKEHYKAEHGWTAAVGIIANSLGCDARTVHRIVEDYERASQLPPITLDAMVEQKIDPAAAKNAGVVASLLRMPQPSNQEEAAASVATVHREHVQKKRQSAKRAAKKPVKMSVEEFAVRIVKQFEDRYRSATPKERDAEMLYVLELVVNSLRADIRNIGQYGHPALVPKPAGKVAA